MVARRMQSVRSIRHRSTLGPLMAVRTLLAAATVTVLAVGCASSAEAPGASIPTPPDGAAEITITISDFSYDVPDSIPAGATVTVVNTDGVPHTVTSSPQGDFDVNVAGGTTGTFTAPDEAGEYAIICIFHSNMSGTLVIA